MSILPIMQNHILLLDGAISTMLSQSGVLHKEECTELLNATHPLDVLDIHAAYLDAGADIITANTFGASALRLSMFGLQDRMEELIQSGVSLCREAAAGLDRTIYVAASIGPTGERTQSDPRMPQRMYDSFFQQCTIAAAAGADILLIETMSDLSEARLALLAARAACQLPVFCSFTLEPDDNTYAGNPPEVLGLCCAKLSAALCGVNCGLGPEELFLGYSRLAGASPLPAFAMPNAGIPVNGSYSLSPDDMATAMQPYLHSGAAAIGGCCGTAPAHIKALRTLLNGFHGHARQAASDAEAICSSCIRLPLNQLEPYELFNLAGLSSSQAIDRVSVLTMETKVLHLDLANLQADAIRDILLPLLPEISNIPIAFHVHNAEQAHAALFIYPGIAAVYAHSDAYRVHKAAARYGAEIID